MAGVFWYDRNSPLGSSLFPILLFRIGEVSMEKNMKIINDIKSYIHLDQLDGDNKKYQKMYDKIAPFYNLSNKIYFFLKFKGEANYRNQFLNELEITKGDKVLEVSCGTGDNFPYL